MRSSSARKTEGSTPYTSTSQSFAPRPIRRSRTHPPTISARPPASRTARASLKIFSGMGEDIGKTDAEGRYGRAGLDGVAVANVAVVFVGVLVVVRVPFGVFDE